jgi:hypothetical protein
MTTDPTVTEQELHALFATLAPPAALDSPVHERYEVRDLGLFKLVFAGLTDPGRLRRLVEEPFALHRQRLAEYDLITSAWTSFSRLYPNQITVRMDQFHEQASIRFWQSILDEPPVMDPRLASIYEQEPVPVAAEA